MSEEKKKARPARQLKKPAGEFQAPHWALNPQPEMRSCCLEVYKEAGNILKRIYIGKKPCFLFGKNVKACDEVLAHESISRMHCALIHCAKHEAGGPKSKPETNADGEDIDDQGIILADLHSSHGTFLNDRKVPRGMAILLHDNDIVRFGGSLRCYKLKGSGVFRKKKSKHEEEAEALQKEERAQKRKREHEESKRAKKKGNKKGSNETVRCSHILVKHAGSRRPSSWLEPAVTRTLEEATEMVKEYRTRILNKEVKFAELAKTSSHCSSAKRGGNLGDFTRGKMQPSFEHTSFELEIGQLSDLVVTESGVHIILRTG